MITAPPKYNTAPGMLTLENVSSFSTARYLFRKVQNVRPANLLDITFRDTFEDFSFPFVMFLISYFRSISTCIRSCYKYNLVLRHFPCFIRSECNRYFIEHSLFD